ncbi:MAG: DUF4328 domain-containing protein [Ilumatobacteraceae bacterium]
MPDVPLPPPAAGAGPPPPPPPATTPVPPPPPPNLTAPPGYVGVTPTPIGSAGLYRIGKLTKAAVALTAASAAVTLISIVALQAAQDDAQLLLDDSIDVETFVRRALPYLLMTVLQAVATLAAAIVTMIWMFRIAKNHRTLHRGGTWGPGWAIGGWFLPPLLYVIPSLMLRELWKASDPDVPIGGDWKSNRTSALVPVWFVLYSLVPLGLLFAQSSGGFASFGASERDLAQQIVDGQTSTVTAAVVSVAGAIAFVALALGIDRRHRRLTGESAPAVVRS